jgi:putative endonuclease
MVRPVNTPSKAAHLVAGEAAERAAEAYLRAQGLTTLSRNYRCRFGEVDLIMQDCASVVFVEVRLRGSSAFGGALASISVAKQRRLIAAAEHYLASLSVMPSCRFDAILMNKIDTTDVIWLKDAFSA